MIQVIIVIILRRGIMASLAHAFRVYMVHYKALCRVLVRSQVLNGNFCVRLPKKATWKY